MSVDVLTQEQIDALLAAANDESTDLEQLKKEETTGRLKPTTSNAPINFPKTKSARFTCSTKVLRAC